MAEFHTLPIKTDLYLSDTRHLSAAQHGAYFLLLLTAWRSDDNALPNDDDLLAKWACMDRRTWSRNRDVIMAFWVLGPDARWRQKRLDMTRKYVDDLVNKKSAAGKASALKRKETGSTPVQQNTQQTANSESESESEIEPNGSIYTKTQLARGQNGHKTRRHKSTSFVSEDFRGDIGSITLAGQLNLDAEDETRRFTDYYLGKGEARADWQASFRTWLRNSAKYRSERQQRQSNGRPEAQGIVNAALRVAARYSGQG